MSAPSRIGPYDLIEEIGRGSMGVVFRGFDPAIGRAVAIKIIRTEPFASTCDQDELRRRFAREAGAAGKLSHPGIVTIFHLGNEDDHQYLVMELVAGQSLEKLLVNGMPLEIPKALDILRQLAAALDYAHGQGVIHRDIKPGNVVVNLEGAAKITDFGVARILSQTFTLTGTILGTPAYMAPEQIMALRVGARADQFSLAVVGYQMLTGLRPFGGSSAEAIMYQILHADPQPVQSANSALPATVDGVFRRALSKDPELRYTTCTEFVAEMEKLLTGFRQPGTAVSESPQPQDEMATLIAADGAVPLPSGEAPSSPKRRTIVILAAAAALFLGLVAVFTLSRGGAAKRARHERTVAKEEPSLATQLGSQPSAPGAAPISQGPVVAFKRPAAGISSVQATATKSATVTSHPAVGPKPTVDPPLSADARTAEIKNAMGLTLLGQGKPTEAISAFTEAIDLNPRFAEAYLDRCRAYIRVPLRDRAVEDCSRAIALRPAYPEAYLWRGHAKNDGRSAADQAVDDYTEAIRLNPEFYDAYIDRGNFYTNNKQPDLAIQDFTQAIRVKPTFYYPYWLRGLRFAEQKDYNRAIRDYDESIRLQPSWSTSYSYRGDAYVAQEQYQRAIQDYTEAIRINPNDQAPYVGRAKAEDLLGDKAGAAADRQRYQELRSAAANAQPPTVQKTATDSSPEANARAAEIKHAVGLQLLNQQKYTEAVSAFTEAIGLNPRYAEAYLDRCRAYQRVSLRDRAVEDCSRAIELKPAYPEAYLWRGNVKNAVEDWTEAIRLNPEFEEAYIARAIFYSFSRKQPELAIKDFTEAIRVKPTDYYPYYQRGARFADLKDYDRAIQDYTEAIRLAPNWGPPYIPRGDAYRMLNQFERAVQDYDEAIRMLPKSADAYAGRAAAKDSLGDKAGAAADRQRAQELKK